MLTVELLRVMGRAGPRVGEPRHFAEAVAVARRLRCGARSPRRAHKLGLGYEAPDSVRSSPRCGATSGCCALRHFAGAPPLTHPRPCGTGVCVLRPATSVGSKAGVTGRSGACAALMQCARTQNSPCGLFCAWRTPWRLQAPGPAAQRRKSAACGGPARGIHAMARSAPLRSHRSRDAERVAQGTRRAAKGAASKLLRPSAPALLRHPLASPDQRCTKHEAT